MSDSELLERVDPNAGQVKKEKLLPDTDKKKPTHPPPKYKIQIQLSDRARDRLSDLQSKTEAESFAQVFRDALRVYGHLVDELYQDQEKKLIIRDQDQKETLLRIL